MVRPGVGDDRRKGARRRGGWRRPGPFGKKAGRGEGAAAGARRPEGPNTPAVWLPHEIRDFRAARERGTAKPKRARIFPGGRRGPRCCEGRRGDHRLRREAWAAAKGVPGAGAAAVKAGGRRRAFSGWCLLAGPRAGPDPGDRACFSAVGSGTSFGGAGGLNGCRAWNGDRTTLPWGGGPMGPSGRRKPPNVCRSGRAGPVLAAGMAPGDCSIGGGNGDCRRAGASSPRKARRKAWGSGGQAYGKAQRCGPTPGPAARFGGGYSGKGEGGGGGRGPRPGARSRGGGPRGSFQPGGKKKKR